MGYIQTALQYSEWALESILLPPFRFSLPLVVVSLIWAGPRQRPFHTRRWKPYHWLALTHLLFFAAAIVVGVLCQNPITNPGVPHHAGRSASLCLDALSYGSFASCAFWVWRMKGFRWYAGSLMALMELPTFGALFVAGMSVAGHWL
jgi:hypothetical protein